MVQQKGASIILRGHGAAVTTALFLEHADNHRLITGDEAGALHVWDLTTEEGVCVSKRTTQTKSPVMNVAQRDDIVYIQHKDGKLQSCSVDRLTNASFGSPPLQLSDVSLEFETPFASMCRFRIWKHRPHVLLHPHADSEGALAIDLRQPAKGRLLFSESGKGMLTALQPCTEDSFLASYEDGSVACWDIRAPKQPKSTVRAGDNAMFALAAAPSGSVALVAGSTHTITALSYGDGKTECKLRRLREVNLRNRGISDIVWRNDGKIIATAGWDSVVRIWSGKRSRDSLLRRLCSLRWHASSVRAVAFSSDDTWLASASEDRTIAAWQVYQP